MNLFRLVYCSRATARFDFTALTTLLDTSRRRNEPAGLSGMLCHAPPYFFQVLEGPRVEVSRTTARIFADPRHTDIILLDARLVSERLFPDWAMQLVEADDLPDGLLNKLLNESIQKDTATRVESDILLHFLERLSKNSSNSPARSRAVPGS